MFLVSIWELLHQSAGSSSSIAIPSSSFRFAGLQKFSVGLKSGIFAGQFQTVHLSTILLCTWMCALGCCPAERTKTFHHHSFDTFSASSTRGSKAVSTMFYCRSGVLLIVGFILSPINKLMCCIRTELCFVFIYP